MDEKAVEAEVLDELTRRADRAIARIIAETVDQSKEIEEIARILAERAGISMEEAIGAIMNAMQWRTCELEEVLAALNLLFDQLQAQVKRSIKLALRAEREKQRAEERAKIHRFHQYRAKENAWAIKKRTGKRRREWRGPWKDN